MSVRGLAVASLIVFLPFTSALAGIFTPNDRLVSDNTVTIKDPEFDAEKNLMLWQDRDRNLWLANIDPNSGDISPATGQAILVDTGLAAQFYVGNGPEFGYGAGEVFLCYTKQEQSGKWFIAAARQDETGNWAPETQYKTLNRWRPLCTPPGTTDKGRLVYLHKLETGEKALSWRELSSPLTERTFTGLGTAGARWIEGQRAFVTNKLVNQTTQLFWVDIDTEVVTQMTYDTDNKYNVFVWFAPEYGELLMSAAVNLNRVGIYRNIDGIWTLIYLFQVPSAFEFVSSPEPFVHNGKSYITVVAASALGVGPSPYLPAGPSELWIANIDPNAPFFRRIDRGTPGIRRSEPEPFVLSTGPAMYFTEIDPDNGNALVRIADTGLGSALAGDSDGDGISDDRDNCILVANPGQRDTDDINGDGIPEGDGIGNACDADLNNNCIVDQNDATAFKNAWGSSDPNADFNGDGIVDALDRPVLQNSYLMPPGPASVPHRCSLETTAAAQ